MTPNEFRRIRRGVLDLTQEQLGERLGVTRETIVAIEKSDAVRPVYAMALRHLADSVNQPAE